MATLEAMTRSRSLDPDVGYWAERWDPAGDLHPLWYTARLGDRWVNVTTLPALLLAQPLYGAGGYRMALLLPMAGSVLAALAARSIARRLGGGDGWAAFWIVGLASPLTVYALDFWEHSLGVAAVAWGVRVLLPLVEGEVRWWRGLAAGALFGLAGTMRTEAFVYGGVAVAGACLFLLAGRRLADAVRSGAGALLTTSLVTAAGYGLEVLVVGQALRAGRTSQSAAAIGEGAGSRLQEAVLTAWSPFPALTATSYAVGGALTALLVIAARRGRPGRDPGLAVLAVTGAALLYLLRALDGLGFVPGLVAASPLVVAGVALAGRQRAARFVLVAGLAPVAVVWATQYQGGAGPQWGARYLLPTALLLTALGAARLGELARPVAGALVGLAVAVTAFGVAWLLVRSNQMADAQRRLAALDDPVLVSRVAHLAREGGPAVHERRWLTAVTPDDVQRAADLVADSGERGFALVGYASMGTLHVDGWSADRAQPFPLFEDVELRVTHYRRS